jgi:hypothetical protein
MIGVEPTGLLRAKQLHYQLCYIPKFVESSRFELELLDCRSSRPTISLRPQIVDKAEVESAFLRCERSVLPLDDKPVLFGTTWYQRRSCRISSKKLSASLQSSFPPGDFGLRWREFMGIACSVSGFSAFGSQFLYLLRVHGGEPSLALLFHIFHSLILVPASLRIVKREEILYIG